MTDDLTAFYRVEAGRIAEVWGTPFHAHLVKQITR
jgi:hypothetical protein